MNSSARTRCRNFIAAAVLICSVTQSLGQDLIPPEGLIIGAVSETSRSLARRDTVESLIVTGKFSLPKDGDELTAPDGTAHRWETVTFSSDGSLSHASLANGYVIVTVPSDTDRVALLDAAGHSVAYVNGQPVMGDPYSYGTFTPPIKLHKGQNTLLFACSRGAFSLKLRAPRSPLFIDPRDATIPDLLIGDTGQIWASFVIVNASSKGSRVGLGAHFGDSGESTDSFPAWIPAMTVRKVSIPLRCSVLTSAGEVDCKLTLSSLDNARSPEIVDTVAARIRVVSPDATHKRTFLSSIDGSVQYYATVPARPNPDETPKSLILSLHGAGVEAIGQAGSYAAKTWCHIVCPTNRRPFGFDWEDWGRLDALEVLDIATSRFNTDPLRTCLTGHSMGGHGAWNIAVSNPDRFAAIAPSAGWISFFSYGGTPRFDDSDPVQRMLNRANSPSDTLAQIENLRGKKIYVLHGDADDNVPVNEAREMSTRLRDGGFDAQTHEQPGAGHWWDTSDAPGVDCVDWAPMFEMFESVATTTSQPVSPTSRPITAKAHANARLIGFKAAFDRRFVLVYGNRNSPQGTNASLAKARFDAQQWYYRANGDAEVIGAGEFLHRPDLKFRNAILYGNETSNAAFRLLDGLTIRRGEIRIGGRVWRGDDLAILAVRPRSDISDALLGIVGWTGDLGARAAIRLPYFTSGVGVPDFIVVRSDLTSAGIPAVIAAGFWRDDWTIDDASIASRD